VSTVPARSPLPDPWNTPVGVKLLDYKKMLKEILKQVQPNLDPKEFRRKDLESHMRQLDTIRDYMDRIMNIARHKPVLEQCLKSAVAVREQVAEARRQMWSASPLVDTIHSSTATPARQRESAVELDKALEICRSSLKGAIDQFRA